MGYRANGRHTLLMVLALLMLISCSAVPPTGAAGSTYYVAPSGSDSNPGTISQPWRTIQKAANTMVAGDTAYVRAGTYNERVTPRRSGSSGNPIAYRAYPGETVIIEGKDSLSDAFYLRGLSYLVIDGFVMRNWDLFGVRLLDTEHIEIANNEILSPNATYSGIWADSSQYCDIHHNRVHDCPENGIAMSHGSHYNRIHHNFVYNNSIKWPEEWEGIGFEVSSNHNHIYNNVVYANRHSGLLTNSQFNYWYHNTVYSNPRATAGRWGEIAGFGGGIYMCNWEADTPENNIFKNNLIVTTGVQEYTIYVQEIDGRNNIFDNNIHWHVDGVAATKIAWAKEEPSSVYTFFQWQSESGQERNGLNANPKIKGLVEGGDPTNASFYELLSDSPAIDRACIDIDMRVTDDLFGNPRSDGAPDIGAFEYVAGTPRPTNTSNPATPTLIKTSVWD